MTLSTHVQWILFLIVIFANGSSISGKEINDCREPMGMEDGRITDRQLTVSSYHEKTLNPRGGRLHSLTSWSSRTSDENQFFEINFRGPRTISGISIQGRHGVGQWVTQYMVSYRQDNSSWAFITDAKNAPVLFTGNSDSETVVTNYFATEITASRLRILPKKWNGWVSMRVEVLGCYKPYGAQCDDPMGMQSGQLLDDQITASSYFDGNHRPSKARLNQLVAPAKSWAAKTNDLSQYLEIYFKGVRTITGVSTQGRGDYLQYVTHFTVACKTNNSPWIPVADQSGAEQIFNGNYDSDTVITHYFDHPIVCSRLRIIPKKWVGHISMRVEIIGCYEPYKLAQCDDPMGMESGQLLNDQITASSYFDVNHRPSKGRLNKQTAPARSWSARTNDLNQYLEIYFKGIRTITGVSIQGRGDAPQYVTHFTIAYKNSNSRWITVEEKSGTEQIFNGNYDSETVVTHYFDQPITCSRIRIIPKKWVTHISLRAEIIGCYEPYKLLQCDDPMGMQNGLLLDDQITASTYFDGNHHPFKARPNRMVAAAKSWAAKDNDQNQYLEIYFKGLRTVTGVTIQGRGDFLQYVTHFAVAYRTNNSTWITVADISGSEQVFNGSYDSDTMITNYFDNPIVCSRLRILPRKWVGHISMRVEIIGCYKPYVYECDEPMGVQNGDLLPEQISASSYWGDEHPPSKGRLHEMGLWPCWASRVLDPHQYLEFYFKGQRTITGISTQGRAAEANQWVTSYTVAYKTTNSAWIPVNDISGTPKIFPGNYDGNVVVTHYFDHPIVCTRLRVLPKTWVGHISMRVEILGCYEPYEMICDSPIGITQNRLNGVDITASSYASPAFGPDNARLHNSSNWLAKTADKNQFLNFRFSEPFYITGISTQGSTATRRHGVTSYTLEYQDSKGSRTAITQISGEPNVFPGNTDSQAVITHFFDNPITATAIKILPVTWQDSISMRVEFHGCRASAIPPPTIRTTTSVPPTTTPVATTTTAATLTTTDSGPDVDVTYCRLLKLEPKDTINMFETVRGNFKCTNRMPISDLHVCAGTCASSCRKGLSNTDNCICVAKQTKLRMINLNCNDGKSLRFLFLQPVKCTCGACRNNS